MMVGDGVAETPTPVASGWRLIRNPPPMKTTRMATAPAAMRRRFIV